MGINYNTSIIRDGLYRYMDVKNPKCYTDGNSFVTGLVNGTNWDISNTNNDISYNSSGYFEWAGINNDSINMEDTGTMPFFTLSMWFYNISGGDSRKSVLRNFWEIVGTNICFWSYDFADTYWRCSPSMSVPYDTWTHVTTTWDGSVIRHFSNGALVWTDSLTSSGTSQNLYAIGGYIDRKLQGRLSSLSIYNRTLSEAEIKQNFNAAKSYYGL